jgi:hypothetical protein
MKSNGDMAGMTVLAHYELMEEVGVGGMGTVHRARDTRDGSIVAVKVLHPHLSRDPDYVRRFEREVRIAQRLDSPRIVRVLDAGADGSSRYIVMEYVEGRTLAQVIHERGQLPVAEVIAISTAVAEALDSAHAGGIVHRDISPQNVLIQPDGSVKVTDFGVARDLGATAMTATSMLLGKPQYIAPEVVTGKSPVDIRSDIYSLGIVMYQMLIGAVPFNAETPYAVMQAQVHQAVPQLGRQRRDVPDSLLATVDKCLAKNPRERFQTPGELLQSLNGKQPSAMPTVVTLTGRAAVLVAAGVLGLTMFGVVLAMSALNSDSKGPGGEGDQAVIGVTEPPGVTVEPTERATEVPTAPPGESATPTLVLEDRFSCAEITGTEYRSEAERQWYLGTCVASVDRVSSPPGNAVSSETSSPVPALLASSLTIKADGGEVKCGERLGLTVRVLDAGGSLLTSEPDVTFVFREISTGWPVGSLDRTSLTKDQGEVRATYVAPSTGNRTRQVSLEARVFRGPGTTALLASTSVSVICS